MPLKNAQEIHPFYQGRPVAFIYEDGGDEKITSFQVRQRGKERIIVNDGIESFRERIADIVAQVVFLNEKQLDAFIAADRHASRPFTEEEKRFVMS